MVKVLAWDVSCRQLSAAVWCSEVGTLANMQVNAGTGGENLHTTLQSVLQQAKIQVAEVGLLATAVGPGSFTGVRMGIATGEGLNLALEKPVVGVPNFEALIQPFLGQKVVALGAAHGGDVYTQTFLPTGQAADDLRVEPQEFVATLRDTLVVGDAVETVRHMLHSTVQVGANSAYVSAPILAQLAWEKWQKLERNSEKVPRPEPLYVKPLGYAKQAKQG